MDATRSVQRQPATSAGGLRRGAVAGYRWMLLIFLVAGVVRFVLAGLGAFSLHSQGMDAGDMAFEPHRVLGFTMGPVAPVILVLALLARQGARAVIGSAVLVLLTNLVQSLLYLAVRAWRRPDPAAPRSGE
jgi:Mn2+/Fe2+ NRAMP family transporter